MKNTLLALALLAFTGSAAFAHEGNDGKNAKGKKEGAAKEASHCSKGGSVAGGLPACCMNKGKAKTTAAATTETKATPAAKSL